MKEVEQKDRLRNFQPALTGEDIMAALDLKPSRLVGEIKTAIREAILEGEIRNTKEDGYRLMYKIAKEKGVLPAENIPSKK